MKWPWQRAEEAEIEADHAEEMLSEAQTEYVEIRQLAAEVRRIRESNGFTDAIRSAMGVHQT